MNWDFVKPLTDAALINEYEKQTGFSLPATFRQTVTAFNGGYPDRFVFDAGSRKGQSMKRLLSFNNTDPESVWRMSVPKENGLSERFAAFAITDGGDLICFEKSTGAVWVLDHETLTPLFAEQSFDSFMNALY